MGLDMYFEARKSVYHSFSRWDESEGRSDETNYPEDLKVMADHISKTHFRSSEVEEYYTVGYFRKFNALHNWIVQNLADGVDDCQRILVSKKDIQKLKEICIEILADKSKAPKLLPTTDGFFFGSTDYDEYYMSDVKDAFELFSLILDTVDFNTYDIIYQASW